MTPTAKKSLAAIITLVLTAILGVLYRYQGAEIAPVEAPAQEKPSVEEASPVETKPEAEAPAAAPTTAPPLATPEGDAEEAPEADKE